jgi:hypothetical protein
MKRKIVFSVLFILIALAGCHRSEIKSSAISGSCCTNRIPEDKAAQKVMGTWKWIETTYFSENQGQLLKTPLNTGKKLTYTFDRDSLIISSEGSVTDKIRYEIGMLKDITNFPQDTTLIIRLTDSRNQKRISLLHFCGDNLVLVNSYNNLGGNIMLKREG